MHNTWQFGLRVLLAGVTLVALASAATAPFLRSLTAEQRQRAFALLVSLLIGVLLCAGTMAFLRRRVERRSGRVLLTSSLATLRSVRMNFLSSVVQGSILVWMLADSVRSGGLMWSQVLLCLLAVCCGFQVTLAFMFLVWRESMVSLALCENGIVLNALLFHPWPSLAGSRWDFAKGYLWFSKRRSVVNGYVLPEEQRAAADRIMHEHIRTEAGTQHE